MSDVIYSYKQLIVWQKAMELVIAVYALTGHYPTEEKFGLAAHARKTVISIPSNIAEGKMRGTRQEYKQFLVIAYGSRAELETQLEVVKRLSFGKNLDLNKVDSLLSEVMKMLNKMIAELKQVPKKIR